jgi:hypothetical protein
MSLDNNGGSSQVRSFEEITTANQIRGFFVLWLGVTVSWASTVVEQDGAIARSPAMQKSVASGKTAVKGTVSDASGETHGVVGVSNSPDGAGIGAVNTGGGPDIVLDGAASGAADALVTEAGIDRPSATTQTFTLANSGAGGLDLVVQGTLSGIGSGLTGVDAALLGGSAPAEFALDVDLATSGSSSVHWDNITDVPADLANGDDDALGGLSCGADHIARWSGSSWVCSDDVGVSYSRTHVVGPVGTPSQNGTALLAAIATIPTPGSQADARLLKIEPGIYDLGTNITLEMKPWVDVAESGEDVTLIAGAMCEATSLPSTGLVVGAERAEPRNLTVENTCAVAGQISVAIFNSIGAAAYIYRCHPSQVSRLVCSQPPTL